MAANTLWIYPATNGKLLVVAPKKVFLVVVVSMIRNSCHFYMRAKQKEPKSKGTLF